MIYNLIKPRAVSSNRYLQYFRRKFGIKKAGFLGTLDPLAQGVFPVFTGNYTRLIPYLGKTKKKYHFRISWGFNTNTFDGEGCLSAGLTKEWPSISADTLHQAKNYLLSQKQQIPPKFSAIKIQGRPAYQLAYANESAVAAMEARDVFLYRLDFLESSNDFLEGRIECTQGYYVRSLARDLALFLDRPGHLSYLVREQVGSVFSVSDGLSYVDLEQCDHQSQLKPTTLKQVFPQLPVCLVDDEKSLQKIQNGVSVPFVSFGVAQPALKSSRGAPFSKEQPFTHIAFCSTSEQQSASLLKNQKLGFAKRDKLVYFHSDSDLNKQMKYLSGIDFFAEFAVASRFTSALGFSLNNIQKSPTLAGFVCHADGEGVAFGVFHQQSENIVFHPKVRLS